ncbi:hypothetical protein KL930_004238 [Ogataea haglerorum]|nr:hypothetical protein KL930_004238 [Ogataea haglerorum]KAG7776475.1 hypothetical protein KL922_003551 [Ogataea haglerorum]
MYSSNFISESLEGRDNGSQGHQTSKQGDELGVGARVGDWVGESGSAGRGAGRRARGAGRRVRASGAGGSNVSGADQAIMLPTVYAHNIALAAVPFFAGVYAGSGSLDDDALGSGESNESAAASVAVETSAAGETAATAETAETVATGTATNTLTTATEGQWQAEQTTTSVAAWEETSTTAWDQLVSDSITDSVSATASTASSGCGGAYAQCGGLGYSGNTCCLAGYQCVTANSYWARCVAATTLASRAASGSARASVSASTSGTTYTTTYTTHFSSTVQQSGSSYVTEGSSVVTSVVQSSSVAIVSEGNGGTPLRTYEGSWKSKALVAGLLGMSLLVGIN